MSKVLLNPNCLRSLAGDCRHALKSRGFHEFVSFENFLQIIEDEEPLLRMELQQLSAEERQGVWLYLFPPVAPAYAHRLAAQENPPFDWGEFAWSVAILGGFAAFAYVLSVLFS